MKSITKYILPLSSFCIIVLAAGYFITGKTLSSPSFPEFSLLTFLFAAIAGISLFVFFRGQSREPESQTMHSLVSVSLKFLLELVLALVWLIVLKKTATPLVVTFFLLYLAFSLLYIFILLNTLRNKSL